MVVRTEYRMRDLDAIAAVWLVKSNAEVLLHARRTYHGDTMTE